MKTWKVTYKMSDGSKEVRSIETNSECTLEQFHEAGLGTEFLDESEDFFARLSCVEDVEETT